VPHLPPGIGCHEGTQAMIDLATERRRSLAATRTLVTRTNAAQLARSVRSHIDLIRERGSVWGDTETAVLRIYGGTEAGRLFGRSGLTAAARKTSPVCCRFLFARLLAVELNEPMPTVSPAAVELLGRPCGDCLAAEHRRPKNDAAGRPRAARPAASTTALTAGATEWRPGGPSSPSGWEVMPDRVPTPEEDATFLAAMARVRPRRIR
jgi:hypothetical protein